MFYTKAALQVKSFKVISPEAAGTRDFLRLEGSVHSQVTAVFILSNAVICLTHTNGISSSVITLNVPYAEVPFLQENELYCQATGRAVLECPEKFLCLKTY